MDTLRADTKLGIQLAFFYTTFGCIIMAFSYAFFIIPLTKPKKQSNYRSIKCPL